MTKYIPYPFFHDNVPVDISFVFEKEKPAGKHGFLQVNGRDFVFEDGTKMKFWGTNFNGAGCFPEHDYARILAERLAKIGINLVRLHQLDAEWHTPNIFAFTKGKRVTDASLDPTSMDRLDYLIYCLKNEGIYCYMDMFTYRKFRSEEGVDNAENLKDAAKPACNFDDHLIALQKEHCRRLWTHENPYTKLAYCDDPVFVMAEIVNESDLSSHQTPKTLIEPYKSRFYEKFNVWLSENGYKEQAEGLDFDDADNKHELLVDFKTELQEKYYLEMYRHMRNCGVKIPITGTNWSRTPFNSKTQLVTDYMDTHEYYYDWRWKEFEKHCMNRAITQSGYPYLIPGVMNSAKDRPTFFSEWDVPWPNEFRAESPIYTAAIGMLQDWSGFTIHTYSYTTQLERMNMLGKELMCEMVGNIAYRSGIFSTWNDPAKFGLFYHAALITRRGDVKPSEHVTEISPLSKTEWDGNSICSHIEKTTTVSEFSFASQKSAGTEGTPKEVLSDTGELYINRTKNYGWVDTDKTKCVYGFLGKNPNLEISGLKVNCETDFAVIAISSLTDENICSSDNILLTTVGRAQNTGFKSEKELITDLGTAPVIVEVIKAKIELQTSVSGLKVWAISPEGFYIGNAPTTYENGILTIELGETSQSMYYLIVKE